MALANDKVSLTLGSETVELLTYASLMSPIALCQASPR